MDIIGRLFVLVVNSCLKLFHESTIMKKKLLFLPDIFLVMLIIFGCERSDLSELRQPSDYFKTERPISLNNLNSEEILTDTINQTDLPEDYKGGVISFIHQVTSRLQEVL